MLEFVGFKLNEEGGEIWAVLEDVLDGNKIGLINEVARCLERGKVEDAAPKAEDCKPPVAVAEMEEEVVPQKIDRQVRWFG